MSQPKKTEQIVELYICNPNTYEYWYPHPKIDEKNVKVSEGYTVYTEFMNTTPYLSCVKLTISKSKK